MRPDYQPSQRLELTVSTRTLLRVLALVAAFWLVRGVLASLHEVLTWLLVAVFFAIALNPPVVWLERRGMGRRSAVLVVFAITVGLLVGFFVAVLTPLYDQILGFVADLPANIDSISRWGPLKSHPELAERLHREAERLPERLPENADALLGLASTIATAVVNFVTVLFLTVFLLLELPNIVDFLLSTLHPATAERLTAMQAEINSSVARYVAANLFVSVICAVVTGTSLFLLGVPFALVLALLSGFFDIVPLFGATLGGIIVCLVAFAHSVTAGIVMVVVYSVYQQIENHAIQPMVMRRSVQVSGLITLIAVLVGTTLMGIVGALLAIPLAASIQIALREVIAARRQRVAAAREIIERAETAIPRDSTHAYATTDTP